MPRPADRRPNDRAASPTAADRKRQVGVSVSYVICLVGSMIGVGAFGGTPIAEAAGGVLSADATHLAPASSAFSVWSVIYAGLAAYTIWQWVPSQAAAGRQRRIGWLVALSMLLNAAWILVIQAGWVWLSVVVIVALLATLATVFAALVRGRASGPIEVVVVDGTIGLYLGWVCVATCANIASALAAAGFEGVGVPEVWAVAVLLVVAAVGVALAAFSGGRLAVAATLTWGLAWIAVARSNGGLESTPTAVAGGVAAIVVVAATFVLRWRSSRAPAST